jgi:hypothetical protein
MAVGKGGTHRFSDVEDGMGTVKSLRKGGQAKYNDGAAQTDKMGTVKGLAKGGAAKYSDGPAMSPKRPKGQM